MGIILCIPLFPAGGFDPIGRYGANEDAAAGDVEMEGFCMVLLYQYHHQL